MMIKPLVEEFEESEEFELFGTQVRRILCRRAPIRRANLVIDLVYGWLDPRRPVR